MVGGTACRGVGEGVHGVRGSGAVPASDRRRAAALGRDESTYRTTWRGLYEWLLERMGVAERQAATQLQEALQTDAA